MANQGLKNSLGLRFFINMFIVLVLLAAVGMTAVLIKEREGRRNSVINEVSDKWGAWQTISGPILTIPYKKHYKDAKGNTLTDTKYAHFLPDVLSVSGNVKTQVRYRGIYEVILYNAKLLLSGSFSAPDMGAMNIAPENVIWKDAALTLGITDLKGIKGLSAIKWNDAELIATSGCITNDVVYSGVGAQAPLDSQNKKYTFALDLDLDGSEEFKFTPLGKKTNVKISSNWNTPSFVGSFLPESRQIDADSFSAEWNVLDLNRNYPQKWLGHRDIMSSAFGVKFLMAVDEYQKTMRSVKYAIMFIVLTFLSFLMIEILSKKAIHPVQYFLVGAGLVLFYVLLLSLSEHILFQYAYLTASVALVLLIMAYTKTVLKDNVLAGVVTGILVTLYGFLYIVLQLQDYALLLGSIGLLAILAIVMYLTRKIDWFDFLSNQ